MVTYLGHEADVSPPPSRRLHRRSCADDMLLGCGENLFSGTQWRPTGPIGCCAEAEAPVAPRLAVIVSQLSDRFAL